MGVEFLIIVLPIVLVLLAKLIWTHKINIFEMFLPIVVSVILIFGTKAILINKKTTDTEYFTEYPIEARHYEDWDEYVSRTCTRTVSTGKTTISVPYDCSYVYDHSSYWKMYMNTGNDYYITENSYNYFKNKWGNNRFVDMNRDYHSYDGDMYKSRFQGVIEDIDPFSYEETYVNKLQTAETLFNFRTLDSIELKRTKPYPNVINSHQRSCIGCEDSDDLLLRQFDAFIGERYEVKIFIIMFDNETVGVSELQRIRWKGGNKNELVVCLDRNGEWVKSFSWVDDKTIETETNHIFSQKMLSMHDKIVLLEHEVERSWKRKHFKDFDYIEVPLSSKDIIWILILTFIISIATIYWTIINQFKE